MKKILFAFLGVVMLLVAAFFWLNSYIYNEKQGDPVIQEPITLSGVYMCLPLVDGYAEANADCAIGMRADSGEYYAIDLGLMSQGAEPLVEGDKITATGLITPIEQLSTDYWQKYPVVGIFSVTDSLKIEADQKLKVIASYQGTLPCGSCSGIETKLELSATTSEALEGQYLLREVYLGEDRDPVVTEGVWLLTQRDGSGVYELQGYPNEVRLYMQKDENTLRQLGVDASAFPDELPYDLKSQTGVQSPLINNGWVWTQTLKQNGEVVSPLKKDAFVLTFSADATYNSSTDCNSLSGTFVVDQEVLSLSPAKSTLMFCDGSQETVYMNDLMLANSFSIEGNELRLNLNRDYGTMMFVKKQ